MAFTPGSGAVISFVVEGADAAQRQIGGIGASINELSSEAKKSLAELAAFAGVGLSLGALAEQVFSAQREFDKLNASLITATGSTEAAAETFKSLQEFASSTPYSVADATEAFIKMKNLGLDPSEKALRSYGNTAAAMGKDLNQMIEAVADASTGEFERLKEFGITASQNGNKVALTFKGTTVSIGKNADEIQSYLQKIGNTDFAGAMAMRAATLDGAISNLSDKWSAFMLQVSQSGLGDAAKFGVGVLADNLTALASAVATVAAARLASTIDGWVVATRKQITETVAARAANIAAAEAEVASTTAKAAQVTATQAMIVVAREEAVAKLASANTNIASAQAAIAAAEAAGTQSFALRTVRLATAELQVAEAQRAAMLGELAILGRQQAAVSAQVSTALAAQTAAQTALSGATAAGGIAAGAGARAMALLGGPIGAVVTVLGLAATAWTWYKQKQDEATSEAEQKVGKMTSQIVADLEKQNEQLRQRVELSRQAGMGGSAAQGGEAVERMAGILQKINELKAQGADISPGDAVTLITYQGQYDELKRVIEANKELKTTLDANSKSAVDFREKFTGVSASYIADLSALQQALDDGKIKQDEYAKAVTKLATDTFNGSVAGQDYAKSLDMASAAISRRAEVQALLNQRQQEHIQFLKNSGQIDEEAAIKRTTAAQVEALGIERSALSQQLALTARKAGSEKEQADLIGKIGVISTRVSNVQKKGAEDLIMLGQQRADASRDLAAAGITAATAERDSLQAQVEAQFQANQEVGLGAIEIAKLRAARLAAAAAQKEQTAADLDAITPGNELAEIYRQQAQQLRDLGDAQVRGAVKQDLYDKNLQDLNAMVDIMSALDDAAQNAAQGMADAFGSVGTAIGGLTTALSGYERTQAAIAAKLAASTKDAGGDQTKIQRANMMAAEASAQAQIKSYGDMAGAAKGFFDQNSAGYKVLSDVEKAYRAAEMAMALESMAKKIFFKEAEVAASTTLNATKVAGEAASTAASVGLAGTAASAWGITAVVKAIASMPFPLNLAAGAATLAAVVGLGVKLVGSLGGSNVSLSQQRQQEQGTGSVLGDKDAKSESIKNVLDAVEKNTYQDLAINSSMLATLKSIDSNIANFASQLVRSTDITNPDVGNLNTSNGLGKSIASWGAGGVIFGSLLAKIPALGNIFDKVGTSIFGGKQSVVDSGFKMDPATLATILGSGARAFQYADIKTSGGWFRKDKTSEQDTALSDAANAQFTSIIKSMADSVKSAGELLGLSGDDFTSKLNGFVVDIGHVSLKGLKGDELQKALESVFSKLGDDMAQSAVGGLSKFQQVGEGYLETLSRLAVEYQAVDVVFQSFGKSFGAVGLASIEARDRLVQLAGGLDKFTSQGEYFLTNFFSDQEQAAALRKRIDPMLAQYGLSSEGENAAQAFRDFAVSLDTTTAEGAQAYATLMTIAPALKSVVDAEKGALDERKSLQDKLNELTMTSAQLREKERAAVDASNLALYDRVAALQAEKDAAGTLLGDVDSAFSVLQNVVAREKQAVQTSVDVHTAAVSKLQSLSQLLRSTLDSMKSPDQQVLARAAAQSQIRAVLASVQAGGALPDAESLKDALSAVSKGSTDQFTTLQDYLKDLYQTQNDIAGLADITDDSLSVEQKALKAAQDQLNALDAVLSSAQDQIDVLKGQSTTLLSIDQAVQGLSAAILAAKGNSVISANQAINEQYQKSLGRGPDAAGLAYWQQQAAAGTSIGDITAAIATSSEAAAQIEKLYESLLGRTADQPGLEFFLRSGASLSEIQSAIKGSSEYSDYQKRLAIPGFATGGDFAGGWRVVGENGPELEATGPARIFNASQTSDLFSRLTSPSSNNDALLVELKALRAEVQAFRVANSSENTAIAKSSAKSADALDGAVNGGRALLMATQ